MPSMKLSAVYAVTVGETGFDIVLRGGLPEALDMLAELGFGGVEYNIADPFKADVKALGREAEERGLGVAAVSTGLSYLTYGYSLSDGDEGSRARAIEFFKRYVDTAVELGSGRVVIGLARGRSGGDREGAMRRLRSSLESLDEYASGRGITLVLEPLNRYETDLINRFGEALEIARSYRSVKILLDTFHATLEERSVYDLIPRLGEMIGHVHVADSNRLAPGMGILDWERIVFRLAKAGYRGYLSVEARTEPSYREMLEKAAETLLPLLI